MKVLVIGASGFVSGAMSRGALAAGHHVWGLSRGNRAAPEGVTLIRADRKDRAAFAKAIETTGERWDLVLDCICFEPGDAEQDVEVFAGRAAKLVFISTDCVNSPIERPWSIDETFDRFETAPYGANKRLAEEVFLGAADQLDVTILRPGHIYGPGSQLGCIPLHGRDVKLIERMRAGEALKLVGGGHFLQQPVFVEDLAAMALGLAGCDGAAGHIYNAAGPDVIASWVYYQVIADHLGVKLHVEEASIAEFLKDNPTMHGFCCHRVYAMDKAREHGLAVPSTSIAEGLRRHVDWLLEQPN